MLVALDPIPAPATQELPKRLQVGRWGTNESTKGKVIVNERTAKILPLLQRITGYDTIALDFEHNTLPGSDAYKADKEPRKIAANGVPVVVPGEGLFVEQLDWTPEGAAAYSGKHFPDLSPAVKLEDDGTVIFMHSSALTRHGSIYDLKAFSASPDPVDLFRTMDPKLLLLSLLGLRADASEAQITERADAVKAQLAGIGALEQKVTGFSATIETLTADNKAAGEKIAALETGLKGATSETAAATITALSTDLKGAKDTIATLVQRLDNQEREGLIAQAVQAGKIVPFNAVRAMDVPAAKKLLEELPKDQVPTQRRTVEGVTAFASAGVQHGEEATAADQVCRQLGIKREDYDKTRTGARA